MLSFLDGFHVSIPFCWQGNDLRCNGEVLIFLHPSNKYHSCYTSNHLSARENVDMEFIYFLTNFSLVIVIKSHLGKDPLVGQTNMKGKVKR